MSKSDSAESGISTQLSLPPTSEAPSAEQNSTAAINVNGKTVPLDHLGPMVINTDGTVSRITNWQEMTDDERARTLRVLVKRNRVRLAERVAGERVGEADAAAPNLSLSAK